jgi:hypothetical protein
VAQLDAAQELGRHVARVAPLERQAAQADARAPGQEG